MKEKNPKKEQRKLQLDKNKLNDVRKNEFNKTNGTDNKLKYNDR